MEKLRIVDAHMHLYDHEQNRYPQLEHVDPTFEALIGDYSALPRRYLLDQYLADAAPMEVTGMIWHEFISTDAVREVQWAQTMTGTWRIPMSIVGLVDFLSPDLEERLDAYAKCRNVTAVREHLAWDDDNLLRRFAKQPDLLTDPQWRKGLKLLRKYDLKCVLEVFSSQLPDLLVVIQLNPDIGFTIALMGWPQAVDKLDLAAGSRTLRHSVPVVMCALSSRQSNVFSA